MALKTRREQELAAGKKPTGRYGRAKDGDATGKRGVEAASSRKPTPRNDASQRGAEDAVGEAAPAARPSAHTLKPEELSKPASGRRAKTTRKKAPVEPGGKFTVRVTAENVSQTTGSFQVVSGRLPAWMRKVEAGGVAVVKDGDVTMLVVGVPSLVDSGKALSSVQATVGQLAGLAQVTKTVPRRPGGVVAELDGGGEPKRSGLAGPRVPGTRYSTGPKSGSSLDRRRIISGSTRRTCAGRGGCLQSTAAGTTPTRSSSSPTTDGFAQSCSRC